MVLVEQIDYCDNIWKRCLLRVGVCVCVCVCTCTVVAMVMTTYAMVEGVGRCHVGTVVQHPRGGRCPEQEAKECPHPSRPIYTRT